MLPLSVLSGSVPSGPPPPQPLPVIESVTINYLGIQVVIASEFDEDQVDVFRQVLQRTPADDGRRGGGGGGFTCRGETRVREDIVSRQVLHRRVRRGEERVRGGYHGCMNELDIVWSGKIQTALTPSPLCIAGASCGHSQIEQLDSAGSAHVARG